MKRKILKTENTYKLANKKVVKLPEDIFISKSFDGNSIFKNKENVRSVLNKSSRSPCYDCKLLKANKNNPVCITCKKIAIFNARQRKQ